MKRLVWLVLAAFCTALAQVQAVEPLPPPADLGECCSGCHGACGMPECALPPATGQAVGVTQAAPTTAIRTARRKADAGRQVADKFFAVFAEPADRLIDFRAPASSVSAASVPLFKEHCSFLL